MFQSNLEFSNKTPAGCAVIKIPAPAGEGEIEFEISRVGSSDNVLGNNGWQPSEHWFLIEGENIAEGIEVLIILEKNIVLNLGNLNYKITVRRVGQRSFIEGVLRGGLRQSPNLSSNIKKIQDRSKLENVTSVKIDKSTSSENAKIILELDKLPNFEEKSLNNPDEKNNGFSRLSDDERRVLRRPSAADAAAARSGGAGLLVDRRDRQPGAGWQGRANAGGARVLDQIDDGVSGV
jgi:hypothetical protein